VLENKQRKANLMRVIWLFGCLPLQFVTYSGGWSWGNLAWAYFAPPYRVLKPFVRWFSVCLHRNPMQGLMGNEL
jgi:hypothetical protein